MTARVPRSMDTLQTECRCLPSNSLTACVDMEGGHYEPVLKKYKNFVNKHPNLNMDTLFNATFTMIRFLIEYQCDATQFVQYHSINVTIEAPYD